MARGVSSPSLRFLVGLPSPIAAPQALRPFPTAPRHDFLLLPALSSSSLPSKFPSSSSSRGASFSSSSSSSPSSPSLACRSFAAEVGSSADDNENARPFVVTTPLYYANAAPHMGSAYPTIAADALARFQKLQGKSVVFITGTDEHGEKIALSAAANGREPKEHCDLIADEYRSLWKELGISYDKFIRTTNTRHEKLVAEFYERVFDRGDIYRADYEGLYCINCEEFKDEKDLIEEKCCPIHRKPCELRREDNYFFALSKYQGALEESLLSDSHFVQPSFRLNEVQGWVKEGLKDFSISRAAVDWGIPVPTDKNQTIYVWFDALIGYISALLEEDVEPTLQNAIKAGWPASVHIIGKDGLKMGKSLGNVIEPKGLVARFGPDAVRFYFLKEIEFGRDGDFSEERFINIVNAFLANTIGNLLNRTLGLMKKNCNSTIPVDTCSLPEEHPLRLTAVKSVEIARQDMVQLHFSSACESLLELAFAGNAFIDERAPWSLFKQGDSAAEEAGQILSAVLEAVRILAVALSPITPELCTRIYTQLGYSEVQFRSLSWDCSSGACERNWSSYSLIHTKIRNRLKTTQLEKLVYCRANLRLLRKLKTLAGPMQQDTQWGGLKAGQVIAEPQPIFKRIEAEEDPAQKLVQGVAKKGSQKKNTAVKVTKPALS